MGLEQLSLLFDRRAGALRAEPRMETGAAEGGETRGAHAYNSSGTQLVYVGAVAEVLCDIISAIRGRRNTNDGCATRRNREYEFGLAHL